MPTLRERLLDIRQKGRKLLTNDVLNSAIDDTLAELDRAPTEQEKPPGLFEIKGKKVVILAPIYRGINGRTFFTLWRCFGQYGVDKVALIPEFQTVIHEARNMLARKFLETDSEWAIMVDDDMVLASGSLNITNGYFRASLPDVSASFNAIGRLMSHPSDKRIVASLYVVKGNVNMHGHKNAGRVVCDAAFSDDNINQELRNIMGNKGLMECERWVGLGFSRIHRSVFEDIIRASEGRWPEILPSHPGGHYGIFQPMGPDVNEDVSFCRRCKALGISMYLDRDLVSGHADGTTVWWPTSK